MIDFHSHVLHHIDDGSHNVDESIKMLKMSYAQGIDTMVFTPHFRFGEYSITEWLRLRQEKVDQIREALTEEDKQFIPRCILGAEIEFYKEMNHWDYLGEFCIKGTEYLMTEMPFMPWTKQNMEVVEDILFNTPYTPIIPHIDRYFHTFTEMKYIERFYEIPVMVQMNSIYINGVHNVQFFKPLFDARKIQLLGSDCHSAEWRQPDLGMAIDRLREICGQEVLDEIDARGREMLKNAVYIEW